MKKEQLILTAICDHCGTTFPSGTRASPGVKLTSIGGKAAPCPDCGGWGTIPDGVYHFERNLIRHFTDKTLKKETLQELEQLLKQVAKTRSELEQAALIKQAEDKYSFNLNSAVAS